MESLEEANLMGESGSSVEDGEAAEGPRLMRMKKAHRPTTEGEAGAGDSL